MSENSSINHDSPSPSPTQDECIEKINKIPDTKSNSDKTGNIDTNEKIPVDIEEDLTTPVVNVCHWCNVLQKNIFTEIIFHFVL